MWTDAVEVLTPHTLAEALRHKREAPEAVPLAGGRWLTPRVARRELSPGRVLDLSGVGALGGVSATGEGLRVGAMCRWGELLAHPGLASAAPPLVEAARCAGGLALRNQGTLGGHIITSEHDGTALPALLVLDADLELASDRRGARRVPLAVWLGLPAAERLGREELLVAVHLPQPPAGAVWHFRRVADAWGPGAARLLLAARVVQRAGRLGQVRVAVGALGGPPLRATALEAHLEGRAPSVELPEALGAAVPVLDVAPAEAARLRRVALGVLRAWLESLAL